MRAGLVSQTDVSQLVIRLGAGTATAAQFNEATSRTKLYVRSPPSHRHYPCSPIRKGIYCMALCSSTFSFAHIINSQTDTPPTLRANTRPANRSDFHTVPRQWSAAQTAGTLFTVSITMSYAIERACICLAPAVCNAE